MSWDSAIMDAQHTRNAADLPLVTLDTNPLIALRNNEPDAPAVRDLLDLNRAGLISVNVTFSTVIELHDPYDERGWQETIDWLASLGIAREYISTTSRSIGFTTPGEPDVMTFSVMHEVQFDQRIHGVLAPGKPFTWYPYRRLETRHLSDLQRQALAELDDLRMGPIRIPPRLTPALDALSADERERLKALLDDLHHRWINKKNDASGFHCHLTLAWHTTHREQAVFVTSDRHFLAQSRSQALRSLGYVGEILPPADAVAFLREVTAGAYVSEAPAPSA
jgi:hypothetical protein